jgi:Spy/CpxP family protein refolding chaperone
MTTKQIRSLRGMFFAMMAASVVGGLAVAPSVLSQQGDATRKPAAANAAPEGQEKAKAPRRRLPPFVARVVTPQQREQIYGVQDKYQEQIDALEAQLDAVFEKRDADINAVLTPEQREQVAKLREEAAQRSAARQAAEAPAAEPGAAAPPAATPAATAKKPTRGN